MRKPVVYLTNPQVLFTKSQLSLQSEHHVMTSLQSAQARIM